MSPGRKVGDSAITPDSGRGSLPATIRAAAFPGKEFAGSVTSIAPLVEPSRLGARAQQGNRSDVDVVEVLVRLTQPGPLTAGMKVDVYFSQEKTAGR